MPLDPNMPTPEHTLGCAQGYFGTPLPEDLLPALQQRRPRGEAIAYARRPQPRNHWEDLLKNLRALPGRQRVRFFVRTFAKDRRAVPTGSARSIPQLPGPGNSLLPARTQLPLTLAAVASILILCRWGFFRLASRVRVTLRTAVAGTGATRTLARP